MKNLNLLRIALGLVFLLAAPPIWADTFTFSLIPPTGDVSGAPGSTVGWGYTITNNSSDYWLVTTDLGATGSFHDGTPMDIFDFPDLAPGGTMTEDFNPAIPTGLYELTWAGNAPGGSANSGNFDLSAQWYNGNPLSGGTFVSDATDQTQPYSASVVASVPEPAPFLLLLTGLWGLEALRKRRTA